MKHHIKYIALLVGLCTFQNLFSQTTKDYFTQEGLSLASYFDNFSDPDYSTSFSYHEEDVFCDMNVSVYYHNQSQWKYYLYFEDEKIYMVSPFDCHLTLFYDFGLEVGNTITSGKYAGYTLTNKYPVTLLNGEERLRYDFGENGEFTSWIEGIGDIKYGNSDNIFEFEGVGVFICAKLGDVLLWENPDESDKCDEYSCNYPKVNFEVETNDFSISITNNTLYGQYYEWDFGDGNTSTEEHPSHTYENPGCYVLTLKVSKDCRNDHAEYTQKISICLNSAWEMEYYNDSLATMKVYMYSDKIEFQYQENTLLKSEDGGLSWNQIVLPATTSGVKRYIFGVHFFNEMDGIINCTYDGTEDPQKVILVTHDGGLSWKEKVETSDLILNMAIDENGGVWAAPYNYYYGNKNYLYRSLDFGDSWSIIEYEENYQINNYFPIDENIIFGLAYVGAPPFGGYREAISYDMGLNWEFEEFDHGIYGWSHIDESLAYVASQGKFLISQNRGKDWIHKELDLDIRSIHFSSASHGWVIDYDNIIYYTNDTLNTYQASNCSLNQFKHFHVLNDTMAYGVLLDEPGHSATGKQKVIFDKNQLGNCLAGVDLDGDGFTADIDCDDTNAEINPDAVEIPNNMIDDDCDGEIDELVNATFENEQPAISIYPNPAHQTLFIENENAHFKEAILYSNIGEIVKQSQISQMDISSLPRGMYLLKILDTSNSILAIKKVVLQ